MKKKMSGVILFIITPAIAMAVSLPQEILVTHNAFRSRHHASPLVWDKALQAFAQQHASSCRFQHSSSHYGENLAAGYPSATAAIEAWYAENEAYSYRQPGFSHETGHFTQLVWKETKKIGCGYVDCHGKKGTPGVYLVCEYSPAGNIINDGYFKRNVLPE